MTDFSVIYPPASGLVADLAITDDAARKAAESAGNTDTIDWFATDNDSRLPIRAEAARSTDVNELVSRILSHVVV